MEMKQYYVQIGHFVDATSPEKAARAAVDWITDGRVEVDCQVNFGKRWWDVVIPTGPGQEFSITEVEAPKEDRNAPPT